MSDLPPISGKVGLDTTDFKSGITEMNRDIRLIESAFRANAAAIGDWANTASGLELRIQALNKEIEIQTQKVAALQAEYERVANEKGATSKAAEDLQIRINKETEALNKNKVELGKTTTALDNFGKEAGEAEKGVQKFGTAMDVAMGVLASTQLQRFADMAGDLFKDMIREASDAEDVMVQVRTAIESTGKAAGLSAEEIDQMATEFSRLTRFEDDAILSGQLVLLQFTKIGKEVFPQATRAMLDLATRMKIDIPDAAKIIGKALEGEFSGLSRFGIVLDEQTKKTIENLFKMGRTAEAQEIILEELNKRFGGSAEAAADTFGGAVAKMKNAWSDFKESIGRTMTENQAFQTAIENIAGALNKLADAFNAMPASLQVFFVGLFGVSTLLAKLAPTFIAIKLLFGGIGGSAGAAAGGVKLLGTALGAILSPVGLLIAAIGLLALAIKLFGAEAVTQFRGLVDLWFLILTGGFKRIFDAFKKWLNDWIAAIKKLPSYMLTLWKAVGDAIVNGVWAGIVAKYEWFKQKVLDFFKGIINSVTAALGISSPSKVFAEIGDQMALGLGVGFERSFDDIRKQITRSLAGMRLELRPVVVGSAKAFGPAGGGERPSGSFSVNLNQVINLSSSSGMDEHQLKRQIKEATREGIGEAMRKIRRAKGERW